MKKALGRPWTAEALAALTGLEAWRVGDGDVEIVRLLSKEDGSVARTQRPGQDDVRRFQANGERDAATAASAGEAVESRPQRRDRVSVDFMGDRVDGVRLPKKRRFRGCAHGIPAPGSGIRRRLPPSLRPSAAGTGERPHSLRCPSDALAAHRSPVGMDRGPFTFARSRHGEGSGRGIS